MRVTMQIPTFTLLLTIGLVADAFGQQAYVVQPRRQSNSMFNPANPNRTWLDYNGRSGREREAGTVQQWVVTPNWTLANLQPQGRTVIIVNPFMQSNKL